MPAPLNVKLGLKTEDFDRGLAGVGGRVKSVLGSAFGGVSMVAKKFLPIIGTFASVGAALSEVKGQIEDAREWERLSRRTGIASSTLRGFGKAALTVGGNVNDMIAIMRKLDLSATKGAVSTSKQGKALKELGIGAAEWASLDSEDRVYKLADALKNSTDETKAQTDAFALGGRKALEMFTLLRQGSEGLKKGGGPFALSDAGNKELDAIGGKVAWLGKLIKNSIGQSIVGWGRQVKMFGADLEFVKNLLGGKTPGEAAAAWSKASEAINNPKAEQKHDGPADDGPVVVADKRDPRTKLTLGELAGSANPEARQAREVLRLEAQAKAAAARGNVDRSEDLFGQADMLRHGDKPELEKAREKEAEAAAQRAKAKKASDQDRPNDAGRAETAAANADQEAAAIRERVRKANGGQTSEEVRAQADAADARMSRSPEAAALRAQADAAERRERQRAHLRAEAKAAQEEAGRLTMQYQAAEDGGTASPRALNNLRVDARRMQKESDRKSAQANAADAGVEPAGHARLRQKAEAAQAEADRRRKLVEDAEDVGTFSPGTLDKMRLSTRTAQKEADRLKEGMSQLPERAVPLSAARLREMAAQAERSHPKFQTLEGSELRARAQKLENGLTSIPDTERDPLHALVAKQDKANGFLETIAGNTEDLEFDNK